MINFTKEAMRVREALIEKGIETPLQQNESMSSEKTKNNIEYHVNEILKLLS